MKRSIRIAILALSLLPGASSFADDRNAAQIIGQSLAAYHSGTAANGAVLRIVYFHPSDMAPQADYHGRIHRIMLDIQSFLKDEMTRNGYRNTLLPIEMKDGKVVVRCVVGKELANGYDYQSGQKVKRELREALKDQFDLDDEFVLVFNGMCRIDGERKYYFHAPYYGDPRSNQQSGLCHVADCEILDPDLLTDLTHRMSYKEHYGEYRQTVAAFNTKYLGGVIHELGHGLGLPHTCGAPEEGRSLGTALMGAGNHTYRQERWSKNKGTFLSFASATRLAAHPLFAQNDRDRDKAGTSIIADLKFGGAGSTLRITGRISGSPDAYAVVGYLDPNGKADYDASAGVAPLANGKFELEMTCTRSGEHQLRLAVCHLNGAVSVHYFDNLVVNENYEPAREKIAPRKRPTAK